MHGGIKHVKTRLPLRGDVAQWSSVRFACERPRVRSPASPFMPFCRFNVYDAVYARVRVNTWLYCADVSLVWLVGLGV